MINYLMKSDINASEFQSQKREEDFCVFNIPFNSTRKSAMSVVRVDGKVRVFVKGAPEIVM